jgi:DNA polymerase III epsilon subunit-like protein
MSSNMFLDLETTGLLHSKPYIVSIAYQIYKNDNYIESFYTEVKPPTTEYVFPQESVNVHGVTTEHAREHGLPIVDVLTHMKETFEAHNTNLIIGHNVKFDIDVLCLQYTRFENNSETMNKIRSCPCFCTMTASTDLLKIKRTTRLGKVYHKYPKLSELYTYFFDESFDAHNSKEDVAACAKCFYHMKTNKLIKV